MDEVPIVKWGDIKEYNKEYRRAEAENRPFIVIKEKRKYSVVHYDFLTTRFKLNEEAEERIAELCFKKYRKKIEKDSRHKKPLGKSTFPGVGYLSGTSLQDLTARTKRLAKEMKKIILDKENWVDRTKR